MKFPMKKITIISERLLKSDLLKLIRDEGASGHTLTSVEGEGSGGAKTSDWEGRNIQIDVIVSEDTASKILERLAAEYLDTYAVIAYEVDVRVLRSTKFSEADGGVSQH